MAAHGSSRRTSSIACVIACVAGASLAQLEAVDADPDPVPATTTAPVQLTLERALELLHSEDPRISAARSDIEAARAARHGASRFANPTLTVAVGGVSPARPMTSTDLGPIYGAQLDQLFESPGKRTWRTAGAEFAVRSSQAALAETVRQRDLAVIRAFYAALLARKRERVCDDELASLEQTRAALVERAAPGGAGDADLDVLQTGTIPYQQEKESSAAEYRDQVSDLLALISPREIGDLDPSTVSLDGDFACAPPRLTHDELVSRAGARPDVVAAYQIAETARAAYRLSADQRVPDVTLGVNATQQGRDTTLGLVASIELPVLNTYAAYEAEGWARWRAANFRYHDVLAAALAEADKAWTAYESARRVIALYSPSALASARQTAENIQTAQAKGTASMLDVLAARRLLDQTRSGLLQAAFAMRMAVAAIDSFAAPDRAALETRRP